MLDPTWAVLWIALGAIPRAGPADVGPAEVIVEQAEVFDVAEDGAFSTATVHRGDKVAVLADAGAGWVAIEPPGGSFDWVDRAAVEVDDADERLGVLAEKTVVRAGRIDARMPGPPRAYLAKGTKVRLLGKPPLILRQGTGRRAWLAVAPRPKDRRYLRIEAIRRPSPRGDLDDGDEEVNRPAPGATGRPSVRIRPALPEIDSRFVAVAPDPRETGLAPALDEEIQAIEARHRRALRDPIERWELGPIRQSYQGLLDREASPAGSAAIRDRLARVARQEKVARAVAAADALLSKSRGLDRSVLADRDAGPASEPFDADGILQESSRQVDGRRVWALIGAEGEACFLDVPPGLDVKGMIEQRVGVRGSVRFDDKLRARLIRVRDLEKLGRASLPR